MARTGRPPRPLAERVWLRVDVRDPDECWPWTGWRTVAGYGMVSRGGSRDTQRYTTASRAVYEVLHGPLPRSQDVCHSCDYPPCCNPMHLFAGSRGDNMQDMIDKGRAAWQRARIY